MQGESEVFMLRTDWLITVQSTEEADSSCAVGCTVDDLHPSALFKFISLAVLKVNILNIITHKNSQQTATNSQLNKTRGPQALTVT